MQQTPCESGLTSLWSPITRELEEPTRGGKADDGQRPHGNSFRTGGN
jgi:hypothetical protein